MIRNWTVFKELWGLPRRRAARGRLRDPARAARVARALRPAARARHDAPTDDGRVYREDSQRVALKHGVAAVSANEATALREAFAEAARWSDVHHRYHTRRRLVQAVFDSGTTDPAHARGRRGRARRRARGQPARAGAAERARRPLLRTPRRPLGRAAVRAPRSGSIRRCPASTATSPPPATWRRCRAARADRSAGLLRSLAGRVEAISRRGRAVHDDAHLALHDREGRGGAAPALPRRRRRARRRDRRSSTPARPTAPSRSPSRSARR